MNTYYMTFPCIHPLHDCWIEIVAESEESARRRVIEFQGKTFGAVYDAEEWSRGNSARFYPRGCIAVVDCSA